MPKKPQTPEEQERIRALIIEVSLEIYDREGLAGVSMSNVARHMGYTAGALYRYFDSHIRLMQAMWLETVFQIRDTAAEISRAIPDPVERIRALMTGYATFAEQNPTAFRSTLMLSEPVGVELPPLFQNAMEDTAYRYMRAAAAEAIAAGTFRPMNPDLAAQTIWAVMHGVVTMTVHFRPPEWPLEPLPDRVAAAVEVAIEGLRAR